MAVLTYQHSLSARIFINRELSLKTRNNLVYIPSLFKITALIKVIIMPDAKRNYEILITEPAERRLKKFDKEIQKRFAEKIRKIKDNPTLFGKPLRNVLAGYWEVYFEHRFRILYTIDIEKKIITIEAIKHKDDF